MNIIADAPRDIRRRFAYVVKRLTSGLIPDDMFLKILYRRRHGEDLDLVAPETFNEKINWLKIHYRPAQLVRLVDKLAVRDFVAERCSGDLLVPLLGVYDSVEDIDWAMLPKEFVLKPTHGFGRVIVCSDKEKLDRTAAVRAMRQWLATDFSLYFREWPYKYVPRRIICENRLVGDGDGPPTDFKVLCFNGVPQVIWVDADRFTGQTRDFYDTSWNRLDVRLGYSSSRDGFARPELLGEMIEAAARLAQDLPFCRIDFYCTDRRLFFGEVTLYPAAGFKVFDPPEMNVEFGDRIKLPGI